MPLQSISESCGTLTNRLRKIRASGRVAHAYLLTGDSPELLATAATAWIQACLCPEPVDGDACGHCRSCRQIEAGNCPDLNVVRPRSRSRRILIDFIRELEHYLHLKSGRPQAGLILEADRMAEDAQNAFLKTLEEPGDNTLLVLATTTPALLLPTIRSRCQTLALPTQPVRYEFAECQAFFRALSRVRRGRGARVAVAVSHEICTTLRALKDQADSHGQADTPDLNTADLAPAVRRRLADEEKAVAASAYLAVRDLAFSGLETWFSQEFMRAHGVPIEVLPNPELYQHLDTPELPPPPDPAEARENLRFAKNLIAQLRYNVDEALAVLDFCQQACAKA